MRVVGDSGRPANQTERLIPDNPLATDRQAMDALKERQVCTNSWAFRHWLGSAGLAVPQECEDLEDWAKSDPERWTEAIRGFAGLPAQPWPSRLLDGASRAGTLTLRSRECRRFFTGAALLGAPVAGLDGELGSLMCRKLDARRMTKAAALVLLDADIRPDDRLYVTGTAPWPWLFALRQGTAVTVVKYEPGVPLAQGVLEEGATILIAPALILSAQPKLPRMVRCVQGAAHRADRLRSKAG